MSLVASGVTLMSEGLYVHLKCPSISSAVQDTPFYLSRILSEAEPSLAPFPPASQDFGVIEDVAIMRIAYGTAAGFCCCFVPGRLLCN